MWSVTPTLSGEVSFGRSGVMSEARSFAVNEHRVVTDVCLALVGETCPSACTLDAGTCACAFETSAGDGSLEVDWAYGSADHLDVDGREVPYCVDGDTLTILWSPDGSVMVYTRP